MEIQWKNMELILARDIHSNNRSFSLSLTREDLSHLYPGFSRYTLSVTSGNHILALFRTNSYEYAPGIALRAEEVSLQKAGEWERDLQDDLEKFLERNADKPGGITAHTYADVVIVQASPRADGNSSTLAQWTEEAARGLGMSVTVLYPHDMDIHECIGCYQCFNSGSCIYDDDMTGVIDLVSRSRLLVICTPVYTNTVPANLKLLIDRYQSYYAAQSLGIAAFGAIKGVILSVSGRSGQANFQCTRNVLVPFMHIAGITPAGNVFIDDVDRFHDIREISGCRERVEALIVECLR